MSLGTPSDDVEQIDNHKLVMPAAKRKTVEEFLSGVERAMGGTYEEWMQAYKDQSKDRDPKIAASGLYAGILPYNDNAVSSMYRMAICKELLKNGEVDIGNLKAQLSQEFNGLDENCFNSDIAWFQTFLKY